MIDTEGYLTCNPKTVTHTINGKENFTDTSKGYFEQELLSNWTLTVVALTMNLGIDTIIVPTVAAK